MTPLALKRIVTMLNTTFGGLIDMSDWANKSEKEQQDAFLSRAVAAYALTKLCRIPAAVAASSVTDEGADEGIDAMYFDRPNQRFYLVQSKFTHSTAKAV